MIKRQTIIRWGNDELDDLVREMVRIKSRILFDRMDDLFLFTAFNKSIHEINDVLRTLELPIEVLTVDDAQFYEVLFVVEVDDQQELLDELQVVNYPRDAMCQRIRVGDVLIHKPNHKRMTMNVVTKVSGSQAFCNFLDSYGWRTDAMLRVEQAVKLA